MATSIEALLHHDQFLQVISIALVLGIISILFFKRVLKKSPRNPSVPVVPGLPLIGNLLQLKDKKPYQQFTNWAEIYGPIYSIKAGASTLVVLNTAEVAKEALVTRFSSISTRKLSNALTILTSDKCMVATSDYNDFHKTAKRYLLSGYLGANAQKRYRGYRDTMTDNMVKKMHAHLRDMPQQVLNLRDIFQPELFGIALKQAFGRDLKSSVFIEDLGIKLSREEIFDVLVIEPMMGAIDVDWRDFFPYLRWVPNKRMEMRIKLMDKRRKAVMKTLIGEQKKRIASGEALESFIDYLLSSEAKKIAEQELLMLIWETLIETSDTTLVSTEWAMYELAKNKSCQDHLYREIQSVCGSDKIREEHLSKLPYLSAVFHETIRKYSPAPIVPLRYVHEDTELGGYHIPAGTEIAINIYGCNMDKKQWDEPEKWKPERFLDTSKYDPTDMYKTMAFGGGKRVCAGSQQAMTITCMSVGAFVQEFEWKLNEGEKEDIDTLGLTTRKLHPVQAIIAPREC